MCKNINLISLNFTKILANININIIQLLEITCATAI